MNCVVLTPLLDNKRLPEMIVIAGPNGSGKTSVTQKFLLHEWAEGNGRRELCILIPTRLHRTYSGTGIKN